MQKVDLDLRFFTENEDMQEISKMYKKIAEKVDSLMNDSRRKTIAIERLEDSFLWVEKGIEQVWGEYHGNF